MKNRLLFAWVALAPAVLLAADDKKEPESTEQAGREITEASPDADDPDGADPEDGHGGDDDLGDVGEDEGHLVPLADPELDEGPGEAVDHAVELPVGDPPAHVVEGRVIGEPLGRPGQGLGDGELLVVDGPLHARGVGLVPELLLH